MDKEITQTAACEAGLCGLRPCKGTVRSIATGDRPCTHECHQQAA